MEIQLQELIDQIKKNGVEAAEAEAAVILEAARRQAEDIVAKAKREAQEVLSCAQAENERLIRVSEEAIRQAARNTLLSFRQSVAKELTALTGAQVTAAYSSADAQQLILRVIEAWANQAEATDITVLLGGDEAKKLEEQLRAALKEHMLRGVTLQTTDSFEGGFHIAVDENGAYYDYSAEAVTNLFSSYLTPRITALLKQAEEL